METGATPVLRRRRVSDFGFWASDFFRILGFGFRISSSPSFSSLQPPPPRLQPKNCFHQKPFSS